MTARRFQGLTIDLPDAVPEEARHAALGAALDVLDLRGVSPIEAVSARYVRAAPNFIPLPDDPDVELYAMQPGEWEWTARVAATRAAIAALADHGPTTVPQLNIRAAFLAERIVESIRRAFGGKANMARLRRVGVMQQEMESMHSCSSSSAGSRRYRALGVLIGRPCATGRTAAYAGTTKSRSG